MQETDSEHPQGIVFDLPDQPPMEITFSEWRKQDGTPIPLRIRIDDGTMVFDYAFTKVDLSERQPTWFLDTIVAPGIDQLEIYRLHRRLLAAHCMGSADTIADLSSPETLISSRGKLYSSTRVETRAQFERIFKLVDYKRYEDIATPVIEVAQGGDIGWIGVSVRTAAIEIDSRKPLDTQWSWVMLAKKVDGKWLNAGNASNHLPGQR